MITFRSTLSGVQGPRLHTMLTRQHRALSIMAPGRRTVCGHTFNKASHTAEILLLRLLRS